MPSSGYGADPQQSEPDVIFNVTQFDIDEADRVVSPVAMSIARTLGVEHVSLRKGEPPAERASEYQGFWLHWNDKPIYLPYRAQIICFAWEYGPGIERMRVVTKGVARMEPWGDIVRPCRFEIPEIDEEKK